MSALRYCNPLPCIVIAPFLLILLGGVVRDGKEILFSIDRIIICGDWKVLAICN